MTEHAFFRAAAIARVSFKAQIVYRFDVSMTALATITRVLFAWILWGVIFSTRETVGGFTHHAMLSYYVVSSFLASLDMSKGIAFEISDRIKGGTFSRFMVIPSHPQLYFTSQTLGAAGYYAIFAALAASASAAMFLRAGLPATDPAAVVCALAMIAMGLVCMCEYQFLIGILSFKFQDVGLHLQGNLIDFSTGVMIPLSLLPRGVQTALGALPFPYVTYVPAMLMTGQSSAADGWRGLCVLVFWTLALLLLGRFAYTRLRTRYDGVGI